MRPLYYFIILMIALCALVITTILLNPYPLKEPTQDQITKWLTQDRDIHLSFLAKPELPEYAPPYINAGNHSFHKQWAEDLTEVIKFVNKEPSKYNRSQCIEVLKEAQATHAGVITSDYTTLKWNYEWFEKYDTMIKYLTKGEI